MQALHIFIFFGKAALGKVTSTDESALLEEQTNHINCNAQRKREETMLPLTSAGLKMIETVENSFLRLSLAKKSQHVSDDSSQVLEFKVFFCEFFLSHN